jgi:hypothetical protein
MRYAQRPQHDLSGSKGTANLVMRFAKGGKENSASVLEVKGVTRAYTGGALEEGLSTQSGDLLVQLAVVTALGARRACARSRASKRTTCLT